jgi:hypothetical protein
MGNTGLPPAYIRAVSKAWIGRMEAPGILCARYGKAR